MKNTAAQTMATKRPAEKDLALKALPAPGSAFGDGARRARAVPSPGGTGDHISSSGTPGWYSTKPSSPPPIVQLAAAISRPPSASLTRFGHAGPGHGTCSPGPGTRQGDGPDQGSGGTAG